MWSNFKITLVRGPHEYPIEQSKQTVKAKSSCQSQQRNANQSKASAHNMRKQSAYHQSEVKLSEQSERLSQPASPPASQPVSQPASQPASQPTNQPTNQQTNQPTNQLANKRTAEQTYLTILIVRMRMRMMIQKVALNSLKIGYVQVKTPKFSKPCSLACNCKIIWVSDSGQVGGLPRKFQSYPVGEAFSKITLNFNLNKDFPVN